jgi:hypothetical protein
MPFRDISTMFNGVLLPVKYENTMFRIERLTRAGYQAKV